MIHVPRVQADETGVAIQPDADWFESASKATARAYVECDKHDADRAVYAHDDVRLALERLFRGKCAYCESSLLNSDWDVEHFRPKGKVAGLDHPGYYWLAYEWSNLYPACVLCNRRRHEKALWGDDDPPGTGGKADQFPLRDEDRRAMSHEAALALEEPLLLDPCRDDPESYLTFGSNGEAVPIGGNARAATTIEILFLNRKRLRELRSARLRLVCWLLGQAAQLRVAGEGERADAIETDCVGAGCEYAAAARAVRRDPAAFGL